MFSSCHQWTEAITWRSTSRGCARRSRRGKRSASFHSATGKFNVCILTTTALVISLSMHLLVFIAGLLLDRRIETNRLNIIKEMMQN
jgi:hypothetical protein